MGTDHFFGRGRAVEMLPFGLYCFKTLLVSSYDTGMKYIQRILHRFATVCTLGKSAQFYISDPPLCVELEQLTGTPPHIFVFLVRKPLHKHAQSIAATN